MRSRLGRRGRRSQKACRIPARTTSARRFAGCEYLDFRAKLKGLGGSRKRKELESHSIFVIWKGKSPKGKSATCPKGSGNGSNCRRTACRTAFGHPRRTDDRIGPRQSAITRKMMERLRGEVSFLLSSHILSEVEACCDRMIILSHGQIVAEGTLLDLQKEFINSTVFEIVAFGNRIDIQRVIRKIDDTCELIQDDPVEVTGKRRFTFPRKKGVSSRKAFSSNSLKSINSGCPNFKSQDLTWKRFPRQRRRTGKIRFLGRHKKRPKIVGEKNQ